MHLEQYEPQAAWRSSIWMFVAGTAIGAVTALMMAPATGRESRDYIRKQGKKVAGDLGAHKDKVASAMKWGQEQASSAMRGSLQYRRQLSSSYDEAVLRRRRVIRARRSRTRAARGRTLTHARSRRR